MSDSNVSSRGADGLLPRAIALPLVAILILVFVLILFPWDAIGRRIAWEISRVSGARVEIGAFAPGLSARGPVLRATDVLILHPAVERVRVAELELAPRFSSSWFSAEPTLRVFARTDLGHADGVLRLGEAPAYQGDVTQVDLARLPLRLQANSLRIAGRLDAQADVALDPGGTLAGRVDFESPNMELTLPIVPMPLLFDRTVGTIEILDTGDTRISDVRFEGEAIEGSIEGEVGLVHRSQSPPIDLGVELIVHDRTLRGLASSAGMKLGREARTRVRVGGTVDSPRIVPGTRDTAARREDAR